VIQWDDDIDRLVDLVADVLGSDVVERAVWTAIAVATRQLRASVPAHGDHAQVSMISADTFKAALLAELKRLVRPH
jgi:hypothetical protein